jgi:hypothetical protein
LPNSSRQRTNCARPLSRHLGQWHLERDRDLVKIDQRLATSKQFPHASIASMIGVDTPVPVTSWRRTGCVLIRTRPQRGGRPGEAAPFLASEVRIGTQRKRPATRARACSSARCRALDRTAVISAGSPQCTASVRASAPAADPGECR